MCFKLSPTSLNLFSECRKCFWLKLNEDIERPGNKFPTLPSGVDRILKQHFNVFRRKNRTPPEIKKSGHDLEPVKDEKLVEKLRDWNSPPKWRDPETGAILRGGIDELLKNTRGEKVVADFKTKGFRPDNKIPDYYRRQLNMYNLLLEKNGFKTADYALLIYYYPNTVMKNGDFVFNTEIEKVETDTGKAVETVRNAAKTLRNGCPDHSEGCDYQDWKPRTP